MDAYVDNLNNSKEEIGWRVVDIGLCALGEEIGCAVAVVHAGRDALKEMDHSSQPKEKE